MSDLDVKPDVSSDISREASAPAYEQRPRARRAVLVFEDDPDFGEFLAPRPQALHPSLIQYPQSTPQPAPQPLHRPPNLGHPASGHAPPNLGHSRSSQQTAGNYQSVEVNQVERPSASRPWPAPPSEYAGRPQQQGAKQGGVSPLVVLGVFVALAVLIGSFVFFFDKKIKRDELEHVRRLVSEVVAEYRDGNRVPEQLKEVVDTLDGVFKTYGFEPVEVAKVVKATTARAVAAEL
ncbi:hypothetical protein A1Q1_05081 [Trichosporon asahii var. asahii CBS 2479]|uniref:Uncharacterized protein n=1 Tax=Trichosporon asahii var. asahii (strain ATCC 90039 / CBS 2479 / JCM 2466 / KCTC 7840 / NBRC 103889/ NCYC 2677 / UAMH 7654) TaxID=1186058 RepID=J6ETZ8_TRIAS|nr:hypothetical protein A1Q1_05081 [Trichosporon asahii var. asahii CBS 2479]EJT46252.1 hypothetical protein A1Q1_05081 [Trichosporon asahii var. asahii CBS 2479]